MTTGGKWPAFCLDFSRSSTRDFPTKNQLPNVLANVRSDSLDQISQTKHSHENVWQLIFWCEGLEWTIAGQARHLPPVVIPLLLRFLISDMIPPLAHLIHRNLGALGNLIAFVTLSDIPIYKFIPLRLFGVSRKREAKLLHELQQIWP